jgi:SSS family solute:Na+ symporter
VFLVGAFLKRARETHALIGMVVSILVMTYILLASNKFVAGPVIAWPWYALIGSMITLIVAFISSLVIKRSENEFNL